MKPTKLLSFRYGVSNLRLRFTYEGFLYFWMLDDIRLVQGEELPVNITDLNAIDQVIAQPNPSREHLRVELRNTNSGANIKLELMDNLGRVQRSYMSPVIALVQHQFDLAHLPSGVYWLRVQRADQVFSKKVII